MTKRNQTVWYGGLKKTSVETKTLLIVRVLRSGLRRVGTKRVLAIAALTMGMTAAEAWAGDAATSASAGSNGRGPGTAAATAQYSGDRGFARTDTRSGPVSYGSGVAYSVDRNGVSLSVSHAVAGVFGPAVASSFNLSIGRDGSVASSNSLSVAGGSVTRSASAGGFTSTGRSGATAGATAAGHTGSRGVVKVVTVSHTRRVIVRRR